MTGIDLNRAGTPLLEIVSEPDLRSSDEAVAYAKALHSLVVWLGICDGNMQEGSFRCDANVSVRRAGETRLGTRAEIKNLNSFRFLQQAIDFEVRRQIELIEDGGSVVQETRLYDPERNETRSMRSKEDAMDYRYFPDPDLLPLVIDREWIDAVAREMPELPGAMRSRFVRDYGLPEYDAAVLTGGNDLAAYFETCLRELRRLLAANERIVEQRMPGIAKAASNWIMGEVSASLNAAGKQIGESPVDPYRLAELIQRTLDGTINNKTAKEVFSALWNREGEAADALIEARGLKQISDAGAIEKLIDEVLAANPGPVAEFRAGKEKAFNSLVGQVMKASRGKANPQQVNDILRGKLAG
jgi:aspartyl-tRNA(Asn)/glutamyl-tRNA(Gln) amidotransferase subunit B